MKKRTGLLLLCVSSTPIFADDWSGHTSLLLGQKQVDDKDWNGFDDMESGGILIDFKKQSWPVSIAVDLIGSAQDKSSKSNKTEIEIAEIDLGLRKIWDNASWSLSPYVGGGIAFVNAEREIFTAQNGIAKHTKFDDDTVGGWLNVGTYWHVTEQFTIGADIRYTYAEVDLSTDKDLDAGGLTTGVSAGFSW